MAPKLASKQKEVVKKPIQGKNEARDTEIYRALTALTPWRASEQHKVQVVDTKSSSRFVKGLTDQRFVRHTESPAILIQDNSFWRALAVAHGGTQHLWPVYKYQTFHYLTTVLDEHNTNLRRLHPRAVLYTVLNGHAGGRNDEHLKRKPADLVAQTKDSDAQVTSEMFQIVADLYSIELVVIFLHDYATADKPHGIVTRGVHNDRQIFLTCYIPTQITDSDEPKKLFYQAVLPAVAEPWDFKFTAHMEGGKLRSNVKRCPFVFGAGMSKERVMYGMPEDSPRIPPPPLVPSPVPIKVEPAMLHSFLKGYEGPVCDGLKQIVEPMMATGIGRKGSVKLSRRESSTGGTPSASGKDVSRPLISVGGKVRRTSSTSGAKDVSRPPISVSGKNSNSGRRSRASSTSSRDGTESSRAKIVQRRDSSAGKVESRPLTSAKTGQTRTPSTGRKPSVTGRTSQTSSVAHLVPAKKLPTAKLPTKASTSTKPVPVATPSAASSSTYKTLKHMTGSVQRTSSTKGSPSEPREEIVLASRTRKTSVSKVPIPSNPAPAQSRRRNSFSRPEVVCRIRTPSPPEEVEPSAAQKWSRKPVIDPKKPPPSWANKNVVGYGEVPESMKGRKK